MKRLALLLLSIFSLTGYLPSSSTLSPLHEAVSTGNISKIHQLLNKDVDINYYEAHKVPTPLHVAAQSTYTNILEYITTKVFFKQEYIVKLLINNSANVNAQDTVGQTPLHRAVMFGNKNVVKILLDNNANPNICMGLHKTPLHNSIEYNQESIAELLIDNNADTEIQDYTGNTPLHLAVQKGYTSIVRLLIDKECNPYIRNKSGKNAFDMITECTTSQEDKIIIRQILESFNSEEVVDSCTVCLEDITVSEVCKLSCNHLYHKECIDSWIAHALRSSDSATCPLCRAKIEM